jgi:uncharacterized protein
MSTDQVSREHPIGEGTGQATRLAVTTDLLRLTRGEDELLLANAGHFDPLYVRRGGRYIQAFLSAASDLAVADTIRETFPHEGRLLDTLVTHRILVPAEAAPAAAPCACHASGRELLGQDRISLYLLLAQSCNMGCVYCLNGRETYQTARALRMPAEIARASILRYLENVRPGGTLEVVFFGGEPLLNWPLAKQLILYCEDTLAPEHPDKKLHYHFTTNLSLLPPDLPDWAKRFGITFLCDVDGPPEIHDRARPFAKGGGTHATIAAHVRQLTDAGVRVDFRATVTALNHEHLPATSRHHKALGGSSSAFVPVNPVNSDEDMLPEALIPSPDTMMAGMAQLFAERLWAPTALHPFSIYAERLRPGCRSEVGCGMPYGQTIVVDVAGNVFPCIYLVGIPRFALGNVMQGIATDPPVLRTMRKTLHVDRLEPCQDCGIRYLCGGGCPLWRLTVQDNPDASPRTVDYCRRTGCDYTRKMIELLLWDAGERSARQVLGEPAARGDPVLVPC